jgi:D-lactate dehydrogenase (cytochrome)
MMRPFDAALPELAATFGSRLSTSSEVRRHHGRDEGWHHAASPDAVVFATTAKEVAHAISICVRHRVPVVPFGAGSGMEGGVNATRGGVAINLTGLNRIHAVKAQDAIATVDAGVTRGALNAHLRDTGLFFPVDPGADATLGGMAATRASGTMTLRYGSMRDRVAGLQVVLADGRVIRTGGPARKSSSGYDMTGLFTGSEGTLGVIVELTLRLAPVPAAVVAATVAMPDVADAVALVADLWQFGLPLARAELMDSLAIEAVCRHLRLDLPRAPTVFLELHGSEAEMVVAREALASLAPAAAFAERPEDRSRLWHVRHSVAHAEPTLRPGARAMVTDVCVPLSSLAACITETQADLAGTGLLAPIVAHLGDGNFHLAILIDPDDAAEIDRAHALHDRLVARALVAGGTITGEHGVGLGKRSHLRSEHGEALDVMVAIKRCLDPHGLMNPGKVFPPDGTEGG